MAINIKNEKTQKLARELARRTGESVTAAMTEALRERLDRVRSSAGEGLAERLVAIGRQCPAHLHEPSLTTDHGELLYGEQALPR